MRFAKATAVNLVWLGLFLTAFAISANGALQNQFEMDFNSKSQAY
jgi:hypothetical protein